MVKPMPYSSREVAAVHANGRVVIFLAADQHAEVVSGVVTVRHVVTAKDHRAFEQPVLFSWFGL
jgi:hypothetical protein